MSSGPTNLRLSQVEECGVSDVDSKDGERMVGRMEETLEQNAAF